MTRLVNPDTGEIFDAPPADPSGDGLLEGLFVPLQEITPRQAAKVMVRVQGLRREQVHELKRCRIEVARLRKEAEKAKARAQLTAGENTVEDRKARARLDSADAFFEVECAEAVAEAAYNALFVLRDDWDTARSIGANERAEKNAIEGVGN